MVYWITRKEGERMAMKNLTIKVEEKLKNSFKSRTAKEGKTIQKVIVAFIKAYIGRQVN